MANCGSLDSLNWRVRCGCKPCLRQMRCTELTLMPLALAMATAVQCVVSPGGSVSVAETTRASTSSASGAIRDALRAIVDLDPSELQAVEPPRGFGRD